MHIEADRATPRLTARTYWRVPARLKIIAAIDGGHVSEVAADIVRRGLREHARMRHDRATVRADYFESAWGHMPTLQDGDAEKIKIALEAGEAAAIEKLAAQEFESIGAMLNWLLVRGLSDYSLEHGRRLPSDFWSFRTRAAA